MRTKQRLVMSVALLGASSGSAPSLAGASSRSLIAFSRGASPRRHPSGCVRRRRSLTASSSSAFPAFCNDGLARRGEGSVRDWPKSALFAIESDAGGEVGGADSNAAVVEASKPKAPEPPRFLALGYNLASLANVLSALTLLWNIGTITAAAPTLFGPADATNKMIALRYQPNILATYTAGALGHLFLAAGTCHILSNSVRSGRLYTSGTYQQLTMGTLLFGLVGMFSLPGEAGCLPSSTRCGGAILVMQLAKMLTVMASFVGWEYAAGGFGTAGKERMKNVLAEIARGCKSVWKTMPVTEERPATFYRTFFVLVTLGNVAFNIPELMFNLQSRVGSFSLPVSLTVSSIARLGLLSSMIYVLKDAAERKRLEGGTFVRLNALVGLWASGVGIAQGFANGGWSGRRAADKLLFGLLFLNNGVLSQLAKMGVIQRRDEVDPDADPPLRIVL